MSTSTNPNKPAPVAGGPGKPKAKRPRSGEVNSFGSTLSKGKAKFQVIAAKQKSGGVVVRTLHITKDAAGEKVVKHGDRFAFPSLDAARPKVAEIVEAVKAKGWVLGARGRSVSADFTLDTLDSLPTE